MAKPVPFPRIEGARPVETDWSPLVLADPRDSLTERFLRRCLRREPGGLIGASALYAAFAGWCALQGEDLPTQTAFGRRIGRFVRGATLGGRRYYRDCAIDAEALAEDRGGDRSLILTGEHSARSLRAADAALAVLRLDDPDGSRRIAASMAIRSAIA